jgi:four helix bundle protein
MKMSFEDLDAWKKAREFNAIYAVTRDSAVMRDFGLCSQIQRASVSIMSNIAEGFERSHSAEKMQAYNVARASCGEVRSLLYVVEDNYTACSVNAASLRKLAVESGSLISGLISSTRRRLLTKATAAVTLIGGAAWSLSQLLS